MKRHFAHLSEKDLLATYVEADLRRCGPRSYRGACPIHGGSHGSFAVNAETGAWYCHSQCQAGGGPVQYLMEMMGLQREDRDAYREALREFNSRLGASCTNLHPSSASRVANYAGDAERNVEASQRARWAWSAAGSPHSEPHRAYIERRGILLDHPEIDDLTKTLDVAQLRSDEALPNWTEGALICPLFDGRAGLRSFRLRSISPNTFIKSRVPTGTSTHGLVMMNRAARRMLRYPADVAAPRAIVR